MYPESMGIGHTIKCFYRGNHKFRPFTDRTEIYELFELPNSVFRVDPCVCNYCERLELIPGEDGYEVYLPVPGYTDKEIRVEWRNNQLQVTLKPEKETKLPWKKRWEVRTLAVTLRADAGDVQNIKARLENGVLIITIPYAKNTKPVLVEIESK